MWQILTATTIIHQASGPVGLGYACMYVCMYVHELNINKPQSDQLANESGMNQPHCRVFRMQTTNLSAISLLSLSSSARQEYFLIIIVWCLSLCENDYLYGYYLC